MCGDTAKRPSGARQKVRRARILLLADADGPELGLIANSPRPETAALPRWRSSAASTFSRAPSASSTESAATSRRPPSCSTATRRPGPSLCARAAAGRASSLGRCASWRIMSFTSASSTRSLTRPCSVNALSTLSIWEHTTIVKLGFTYSAKCGSLPRGHAETSGPGTRTLGSPCLLGTGKPRKKIAPRHPES